MQDVTKRKICKVSDSNPGQKNSGRICRQGKNSGMHVCRKRTKNYGRKRVQLYCDRICEVPLHHRTTIT